MNEEKSKLKEYLTSIKIKIRSILTPIIYADYCVKFTIALDLKRLTYLRNTVLSVNISFILLRILVPSLISLTSLILSLCYNIILFFVIISWKKRDNRKGETIVKKDVSKIKIKPMNIKIEEVPKMLNKFKEKEEKNNGKN